MRASRRLEAEPGDVLRDGVHAEERRHLGDRGDAAGKRRVQHQLDRVLDVPGVDLLAVVELHALAEVEEDRLLVGRDLPGLRQRRLQVQVLVPLDERVVGGLLAPVVGGQDGAEGGDVHRVLLQGPGDMSPVADLGRGEGVLRRCLRGAGRGAGSHCACRDDPCLDERVATGEPPAGRVLRGFLVGHSYALLSCGPVRGSDRPWELHPRCRRKRRTRAPECWPAARPPPRSISTPRPGAPETSMKPSPISTGSVSTSSSCSG